MIDLLQAATSRRMQGVDGELVEEALVNKGSHDIAHDQRDDAHGAEQQHRPIREGMTAEDFECLRGKVVPIYCGTLRFRQLSFEHTRGPNKSDKTNPFLILSRRYFSNLRKRKNEPIGVWPRRGCFDMG